MEIDITIKKQFRPGVLVEIETESDKGTGKLTRGRILRVLSKENQKKGIKVELTTGETGRIKHVPTLDEIRLENFKFYNQFFFLPKIFSIWNKKERCYLLLDYPNAKGMVEKTAFLYETKGDAEELLKLLKLPASDFMVKEINRRKPISQNFKSLDVDVYRLNRDRKLTYEKLNELEHYFKSM